jgi:hypothetical protein
LRLSARVLVRLEQAEANEVNPHYRDDIRVAWITALNAARGVSQPHIVACYAVLGLHPSDVWPAIVARRKAKLGPFYEKFFGVDLPPKKPAGSVRVLGEREAARARPEKTLRRGMSISAPLLNGVENPCHGRFNSASIPQFRRRE